MDKSNWKFIRTGRILQSLEEATLDQLQRDTIRGFPGTKARQNATHTVQITQKTYTPFEPSHALLVKAVANNQGRVYYPEMFFEEVVYEDEDTPNNVTFTGTDGEMHHIQPIQFQRNNTRVKCTCLDFHYRFAQTNARSDSLYGEPPPPYQRKTTTHPPANPMRVPGLCKHLIKLVEDLRRDKILR